MRGLPAEKAAQSPWGGRTPRAWDQVRTAGLGAGSRVDGLRGGTQPRALHREVPGPCEPGREPATVTRWCPPAGTVETGCANWTDRKKRCFSRPCFVTSHTRPVPRPKAGPQAPPVPGQPSLTRACWWVWLSRGPFPVTSRDLGCGAFSSSARQAPLSGEWLSADPGQTAWV